MRLKAAGACGGEGKLDQRRVRRSCAAGTVADEFDVEFERRCVCASGSVLIGGRLTCGATEEGVEALRRCLYGYSGAGTPMMVTAAFAVVMICAGVLVVQRPLRG